MVGNDGESHGRIHKKTNHQPNESKIMECTKKKHIYIAFRKQRGYRWKKFCADLRRDVFAQDSGKGMSYWW